ncbi:MAG: glutamate--tRNA ligase [Parvularculaceae bacterium]
MTDAVVTRFAPSPTGYLHIGGARTALFNWLYARGRGGKFLLRIEDTARARHSDAAVEAILHGLSWLGLDWDGEPISQFARVDRHAEVATTLLEKGAAYRCYMTPEEIETARAAAREAKTRFESPWRDQDRAPAGQPHTIRFKAPREGETLVADAVQGEVTFPNGALDDLILLRSDGAPTYNLAVVVDDHDMGVTHVIRGDDHLNNAARQSQLYAALDWPTPVFAHAPLIHGPDGAKLSKRHGALGVEAYRDDGFLPEALANYLLRLGWSHGAAEVVPRDEALRLFDLGGINKAPARLDLDKLRNLNGRYVADLADDDFAARAAPFLADPTALDEPDVAARFSRAAPYLKPRVATLTDVADAARFALARRPLAVTGKAGKPLRKEGALDVLRDVRAALADADWTAADALDAAVAAFVKARGLSLGQAGPPLRAALTAGAPSPSLGETLFVLGRDESLARIDDQLEELS